MMEKEIIIGKMALFIANNDCGQYHDCSTCAEKNFSFCKYRHLAVRLYESGVIFAPKGTVILTKEEYTELKQRPEKVRKEMAIDILKQVKSFLDVQTKTIVDLSKNESRFSIPENCKECYIGSQVNRVAELKRIAQKYGVEIE